MVVYAHSHTHTHSNTYISLHLILIILELNTLGISFQKNPEIIYINSLRYWSSIYLVYLFKKNPEIIYFNSLRYSRRKCPLLWHSKYKLYDFQNTIEICT